MTISEQNERVDHPDVIFDPCVLFKYSIDFSFGVRFSHHRHVYRPTSSFPAWESEPSFVVLIYAERRGGR
jgi:hypothetical protein